MLKRAWSTLEIKAVDDEQRVIEGIASTPTPDRQGDIMDPAGAKFSLPMPLLLQHNQNAPIGEVFDASVKADGIYIKARLPKIAEAGAVRDRVESAWQQMKSKPPLIRGLSIGWAGIKGDPLPNTKFFRWSEWHWGELSAVTVPANSEATITAVKAADLAAPGLHSPGDTGLPVVKALKDASTMKTTADQIKDFENTRGAKLARMNAIQEKASSEGRTKDEAEREEFTTLELEIKSLDAELSDLRKLEKANLATATQITGIKTVEDASSVRGGNVPVVSTKSVLPKGTSFVRYAMAKGRAKGNISDAIRNVEQNKVWMDQTPEVLALLKAPEDFFEVPDLMMKAVVNWGTIAEPAWAAPLAVTNPINDFLELLRPATLIGKIMGLRQVPFNISMPAQTGGGTYAWVGEGAPKPVGQLQLQTVSLSIAKAAGILVFTEELARLSTPSAENVVRNDMVKGMAQFLDLQFIDPTVAAVTNVNPASITNLSNGYGSAGTAAATNGRTDLQKGITLLTQANYNIGEVCFIMSEANAFILSAALTTNGVPFYPNLTAKGGTIFGVPVYTSQSAGNVVATVHPPSILYADEGGVNIDVSREAAVEMNTVPTSPVTASSVLVSLWQNNLVGLRAERFINWKRARTTAVVYTTQAYV